LGTRKEHTKRSLLGLRECIVPAGTINAFPLDNSSFPFSKTPKPETFMQ
jgi:hypothetical protein